MKKIVLLTLTLLTFISYSSAQEERVPSKGFAVHSHDDHFHPYEFTRHAVRDNDILIEIMYAGICHSDIHGARDEQKELGINAVYPMVSGHEMAGKIVAIGKDVTKFKVGDLAGVGCMVNACGTCSYCLAGKEEYCENKTVFTYGSADHFHDNENTKGGYSNNMVVSENFAIKIPANAQLDKVAPLLCAGITTYSPIRFSNVKVGDKVGVAGYGGLGHMAVQYLVKLGAEVTIFDITEEKRQDALRMGASRYVNVKNEKELEGLNNSMSFIISTIPYDYDPLMYMRMLKMGGEMAVVGLPENSTLNVAIMAFAAPNRKIYSSLIGGIAETQEMLDYSVANNIYPEVEIIKAEANEIDKAYNRVSEGDVKFRFVMDMSTLK